MSSNYIESLGLKRNPFNPAPLDATVEDIGLFVGREVEINRFKTILASTPGSLYRIVLMGTYGTGKTSLLNRLFWEAQHHEKWKFATVKIVGKEDLTYIEFILSLIDNFTEILKKANISKKNRKIVEEIRLNLDFQRQLGSETSSEITGTLSAVIASLAGKLGVKESEIRTPLAWTERSAIKDLKVLLNMIFEIFDGAVVGIDEVDYLASNLAREVLKKGREEIFQRKNFLFVFSGTIRFRSLLEEIGSPVREIIDGYFTLEPFKYPEERNILNELVNLRLKSARIEGNQLTLPFDKASMDLIFTLSNGIPRRVLRFLQASMDSGIEARTIVNTNLVLSAVRQLGKGHYSGLQPKERDIVKLLAQKELLFEKDFEQIRRKLGLTIDEEKTIRRSLESQGLLYSEFEGKDSFYMLAPEIRVFVLYETKLITPILQIETAQKIRLTIHDEQDPTVKQVHLRTAHILECQGHLGLLFVEYDSLAREERLSHHEKAINCLRELSDPKVAEIIASINAIQPAMSGHKKTKTVKERLCNILESVKEYSKASLEPSKSGKNSLIITPDGEHSIRINLDDPMDYQSFILYQALMRNLHQSHLAKTKPVQIRLDSIAGLQGRKEKSLIGWLKKENGKE
jgi:hypothetical protein